MLELEKLEVAYGQARVLFGLSLSVSRGEVVALLGRNGAGKSTTLKAVMALVPAAAGAIRLDGRPLNGLATNEIARLGVGYVPEERRIFTRLTVAENLETGRRPPREDAPSWDPEALFRLFPNLAEMRERLGGRMSGGEQQMLALARTLMGNPRVLLLDEPSEGLAPRIVEQMAASIQRLKGAGLTVLLSEQNLRFAGAVADRGYVIETGRVRRSGTMAELAADEEVRRRYLAI